VTALRTAVIGVGYMGRFHAQKLANCKGARLLAVVDADGARAQEVAREVGSPARTDYRSLLGEIDAAVVAVPTELHYAVVRELLQASIHVLVEKPLARSVREADELLALARRKRVVLQVGHLERFNPAFRALAAHKARPLFIDIERLAPFKARGTDVDVVLDLMIHDLDVILSMMASPVAAVEAVGVPVITVSPDIANARIRFADGAIANVTASRVSLKRERKLRIFQPDTYISLDYGEKRVRICRRGDAPPGGLAPIEVEERVVEGEDALAEEIRAFVEAVRTRREPLVSGREGLRAVELAYQILACVEEELRRSR
jgi:predicted dehydrogenase